MLTTKTEFVHINIYLSVILIKLFLKCRSPVFSEVIEFLARFIWFRNFLGLRPEYSDFQYIS